MLRKALCLGVAAVAVAGALGSVQAVDVTVTQGTMYQTIEGFGAFGSIKPWKVKQGPFYFDVDLEAVGFYDSMVTELGATMWRTGVPSDGFEPSAGAFNRNDGGVREWMNTIRKLSQTANEHGEPVKFISSCWSPPGWMKAGGIAACGVEGSPALSATTCKLSSGMEDDLGRHFAEWVDVIKDSTGVDLYALSIQNEPAFSEPYESCVYDGPRYRDVLKIVAPLVRAVSSQIRFYGAEHMSWAFPNAFESTIRNDATALNFMHAWAVHGYTNGVATDTGAYSGSTPTDKVFWMTETSGGGYGSGLNDWPDALTLGRNILGYLKNGRMTAWTWWSLQDIVNDPNVDLGEYCLIMNGSKTAKYYVSSHFYRFVRPGARQVLSSSTDSELEVVAFKHVANNCLSIVLINRGTAAKTVNLNGVTGYTSFEMHTSTSTAKRTVGTAGVSGISIPASSVVTLVSGAYRSTLPVSVEPSVNEHSSAARAESAVAQVSVYTADGKLVRRFAGESLAGVQLARGVYQAVFTARDGSVVRTAAHVVK